LEPKVQILLRRGDEPLLRTTRLERQHEVGSEELKPFCADRPQQLILVLEVPIHRRRRHARAPRHFPQRELDADLQVQVARLRQQSLASAFHVNTVNTRTESRASATRFWRAPLRS